MNGVDEAETGCRGGEGADSNKQTKTTKRHESCACALEQDEEEAGESDEPGAAFEVIPRASIDGRGRFEQGGSPPPMLSRFG